VRNYSCYNKAKPQASSIKLLIKMCNRKFISQPIKDLTFTEDESGNITYDCRQKDKLQSFSKSFTDDARWVGILHIPLGLNYLADPA
jgi:hypothetical protein